MKKRLISGIKPSGKIHIGNYLGSIKKWLELQGEYESFFFLADYHATCVRPYYQLNTEQNFRFHIHHSDNKVQRHDNFLH